MSNILRGQDSIDIIKPIAEPYEDDYVNNDTQEISEIDKQEEQENHNEFEIKRGAEAIALMGTVAVTVNELIDSETNKNIDFINPGKIGQTVKMNIPFKCEQGYLIRRKR